MRRKRKIWYSVTSFSRKHISWYNSTQRWCVDNEATREDKADGYSSHSRDIYTFKKAIANAKELRKLDKDCEVVIMRFIFKKGKRKIIDFYLK